MVSIAWQIVVISKTNRNLRVFKLISVVQYCDYQEIYCYSKQHQSVAYGPISEVKQNSLWVNLCSLNLKRYNYRPRTEYDGKVMFWHVSVCLFTGGGQVQPAGGGQVQPAGGVRSSRGGSGPAGWGGSGPGGSGPAGGGQVQLAGRGQVQLGGGQVQPAGGGVRSRRGGSSPDRGGSGPAGGGVSQDRTT